MVEVLRFLQDRQIWVYFTLGIFAFWWSWKFVLAWSEYRRATFGLEREKAQEQINSSVLWLVLLLAVATAEFMVISFIVPTIPDAMPLPTATLNLLATPTTTLPAGMATTSDIALEQTVTPEVSGCVLDQVMISEPIDGDEVSERLIISGTVNIENLGFYKFEWARAGENNWETIGGGRDKVVSGKLGELNIATEDPGEYLLRLVVADSSEQYLPPCVVHVVVKAPPP